MTTGKEYAARPQMDAPTFYGMRLAMFEALKTLKEGEHAHPPVAITKASVARVLREESYKNEYLQAAGTEEIIARYFENLVGQSSDKQLKAFADGFTNQEVADVDKALHSGSIIDKVMTIGQLKHFNDAAKTCFGMNTLTESLADYYKNHGASLADVTVTRSYMNRHAADRLTVIDRDFRMIDHLTPPEVQQHIEKYNAADYVLEVSFLDNARQVASNITEGLEKAMAPKGTQPAFIAANVTRNSRTH